MEQPPKDVTVVPIEKVKYSLGYYPQGGSFIHKLKEVLTRQGLIEPICVHSDWSCWGTQANELLEAAHALEWPTVIVVYSHPEASS